MILTGVTKSMLEKAAREDPLLQKHLEVPPVGAIEEIAKAMFEHTCADWECDEQKLWDELVPGSKQCELQNATWLIGRLAHAGYIIVKTRAR